MQCSVCARLRAWLHASKTRNVSKEQNVSAAWLNVSKTANLRCLIDLIDHS
jgi:hypothetical protein